jgi:hypothetical protein
MTSDRTVMPTSPDLVTTFQLLETNNIENEKQRVIARFARSSLVDTPVKEDWTQGDRQAFGLVKLTKYMIIYHGSLLRNGRLVRIGNSGGEHRSDLVHLKRRLEIQILIQTHLQHQHLDMGLPVRH